MNVRLVWSTPDGDNLIAELARVSNPGNQDNKETAPKLLKYLINHKHWSPFEMVHACVEIETTRDISRQILRHRSFSFQEFSGRYAQYGELEIDRECRLQDASNRQNSLKVTDEYIQNWWKWAVKKVGDLSYSLYEEAIKRGIAKEVARAILPEGLVKTRMYMVGSMRSWIHYWNIRCGPETQKEHRLVAEGTRNAVLAAYPELAKILEENTNA